MKKVIVETECGEETVFYVAQDVESITVDGEEWVKKTDEDKGDKVEHRRIEALGCYGTITPVNNDLDEALARIKTLRGPYSSGSLIFIPTLTPNNFP